MDNYVMTVPTEKLYEISEEYMAVMCGFNRESKSADKIRKNALDIRKEMFEGTNVEVLYAPFTPDNVKEKAFLFDNTKIDCSKLANLDKKSILGGYVFMFHAPVVDISQLPISKAYLVDSWQTSFVDVGRDYLREQFYNMAAKEYKQEIFITDTIAPGMFSIEGDKVKEFFEFMDGDKIGLKVMESGMMNPLKSFVGIFLILNKEDVRSSMNCDECLSNHKSCEYCKNYAQLFIDKVS